MSELPDHSSALEALVGQSSGPTVISQDAVNVPMIRHWVEAMGDENPVYLDEMVARACGFSGIVAPASMLQAWIMRGLKASQEAEADRAAGVSSDDSANGTMMALLDDEGRTSVVATNCEQQYLRPLHLGDRLLVRSSIEAISAPKMTGLGDGRFATTLMEFFAVPETAIEADVDVDALADAGELVATMRFRILKFIPRQAVPEAPAKPKRPRPAITEDNAFFFEGTRNDQLLIQRCVSCSTLRHPPLPACGQCGSLDWDTIESNGEGELFSMVTNHYPQVPAFDYPLPIGLIALDEGTRIVANLDGNKEDLVIGARVKATIEHFDDELALPVFRPITKGDN